MTNSTKLNNGLIHFYYGNGCGKTSIAIGHIIRAYGRGLSPILVQFLKKHDPSGQKGFFYGEYLTLSEKLNKPIPILQYGDFNFVKTQRQIENQKANAQKGLAKIKELLFSSDYDLVILDEIGSMIKLGLFEPKIIVNVLNKKKSHIEVILTGHEKIPEFIELADYVTHLEEIKHPFQNGIMARAGIEY